MAHSEPAPPGSGATPPERREDHGDEPTTRPRGYARARAADDAARSQLEPLAPGERPLAIKLSALTAAAIAIGNLALLASGWELRGVEEPGAVQALAIPAFMLVLAAGIWTRRYWALVAFQAVLAITIIFAFLFLLRASNLQGVALCLGIVAVAGTLFWFLVRAMARAQMPRDSSR